MMKGMVNPVVIVALLLVGGLLYAGGYIPGASLIDGKAFIQPQFGHIDCEQIGDYTRTVTASFTGDKTDEGVYVEFGDTENAPSGDWYAYCVDSDRFSFQCNFGECVDGIQSNGECPLAGDDWCAASVYANQVTRIVSDVKVNEIMRIGGCYNDLIVYKDWKSGQFQEGWEPFGLVVYDSGGRYQYRTQSCRIDFTLSDYNDVCKDDDCGENTDLDILPFYQSVNYLSSFVYAPIDNNNKIVQYDGQTAYCQPSMGGATVYAIDDFETLGAVYMRPSNVLASVDCCPGMEMVGSYCGDDFNWHDSSIDPPDVDCFSAVQCFGQGTWVPDYSTSQNDIIRYDCVDGFCEKVETRNVECTPPDVGCPDGWLCAPDEGYICVQQIGPGLVCGDGVCSSPFEDTQNCPADCETFDIINFLATFLGTFIIGVFVMGIILAVLFFIPQLRPVIMALNLNNVRFAIGIALIGGLAISLLFTVPLLAAASLI